LVLTQYVADELTEGHDYEYFEPHEVDKFVDEEMKKYEISVTVEPGLSLSSIASVSANTGDDEDDANIERLMANVFDEKEKWDDFCREF
jgi:hypothetical protein